MLARIIIFSIICFVTTLLHAEDLQTVYRGKPIPHTHPKVKTWKKQMIVYGNKTYKSLTNTTAGFDPQLAATYYDLTWVFYQIADYTRDNFWKTKAQSALAIYRDQYVIKNNGYVPGYWNFSHGITRDYLETKKPQSKLALELLAKNAAYARADTNLEETKSPELSREVAYAIMTYLNAEKIGIYNIKRKKKLIKQALGHMDSWCISHNADYVRPFMVSLTMQALISVAEINNEYKSRVKSKVIACTNWLWNNTWNQGAKAFAYTDRLTDHGGTDPAPDLNLLIAPAYAWLYNETGDTSYYYMASNIFNGGVKSAYLDNPKQFNQNYRWSFDFMRWMRL